MRDEDAKQICYQKIATNNNHHRSDADPNQRDCASFHSTFPFSVENYSFLLIQHIDFIDIFIIAYLEQKIKLYKKCSLQYGKKYMKK